ncbi:hypothetical protein QAD02_001057 [Eretmocerus hayati]|uniref:Uncharacterized protein n=1 Tax=Eretmocerus hayati TaxID=131215 RepID=A0ACC2NG87_9HYME|nr:hypothetical protein QAD02_001057 [Eretmocerus hayati]
MTNVFQIIVCRIITLSIISFISCIEASPTDKLQTVYQWRYFDYVWPSESDKQNAIRNGVYNYSQIIPMDVDVAQDGRVFISLNYYFGTPARLAVITDQIEHSGPLLQPYPNWEWYDNDCNGIIDAVRIEIDNCNRLWVVDGGREEPGRVVCPSKILAFDLSTDTLVEEVILPYNISRNAKTNQTLLSNVRVETHGANCEKTTVTVAQDHTRLQFVTSLRVTTKPNLPKEELWAISNRFQAFKYKILNFNEFNFHIMKADVGNLIKGTKCEKPRKIENGPVASPQKKYDAYLSKYNSGFYG